MTIEIAISLQRVLDEIYAMSALGHYLSHSPRPEILGRDNSSALCRLARHACAELVYSLGACVRATNLIDEPDADIITVSIEAASDAVMHRLRPLMQSALSASVLAIAYSGVDTAVSDRFAGLYADNKIALRRLAMSTDAPARLRPAM